MSKEISIEQVQALMKSVADNHLGELCLETEGVKLKIKNWMMSPSRGMFDRSAGVPAGGAETPAAAPAARPAPVPAEAAPAPDTARYLVSPIVGTFYASASPDHEAFADVGRRLEKGDVAFIVESMKVMNEVPADQSGVVAEILVENGEAVEYGQNILRLE